MGRLGREPCFERNGRGEVDGGGDEKSGGLMCVCADWDGTGSRLGCLTINVERTLDGVKPGERLSIAILNFIKRLALVLVGDAVY